MDSRLRGNDHRERGNDKGGCGNDNIEAEHRWRRMKNMRMVKFEFDENSFDSIENMKQVGYEFHEIKLPDGRVIYILKNSSIKNERFVLCRN